MLNIDQLALHLPAGFEHRAEHIARLTINKLGQTRMTKDISMSQLSLPPMVVNPAQSDLQIAQQISSALLNTLNGNTMTASPSVCYSANKTRENKPC